MKTSMAFEATLQWNRSASNHLLATASIPTISTAFSLQNCRPLIPTKSDLAHCSTWRTPDDPLERRAAPTDPHPTSGLSRTSISDNWFKPERRPVSGFQEKLPNDTRQAHCDLQPTHFADGDHSSVVPLDVFHAKMGLQCPPEVSTWLIRANRPV